MLETVGHLAAVNAGRALPKAALERGWPMLTVSNAVPLREGLRPSKPAATLTLAGTAAAAASIAWYASRRRRGRLA
jgi:hypothetical protein